MIYKAMKSDVRIITAVSRRQFFEQSSGAGRRQSSAKFLGGDILCQGFSISGLIIIQKIIQSGDKRLKSLFVIFFKIFIFLIDQLSNYKKPFFSQAFRTKKEFRYAQQAIMHKDKITKAQISAWNPKKPIKQPIGATKIASETTEARVKLAMADTLSLYPCYWPAVKKRAQRGERRKPKEILPKQQQILYSSNHCKTRMIAEQITMSLSRKYVFDCTDPLTNSSRTFPSISLIQKIEASKLAQVSSNFPVFTAQVGIQLGTEAMNPMFIKIARHIKSSASPGSYNNFASKTSSSSSEFLTQGDRSITNGVMHMNRSIPIALNVNSSVHSAINGPMSPPIPRNMVDNCTQNSSSSWKNSVKMHIIVTIQKMQHEPPIIIMVIEIFQNPKSIELIMRAIAHNNIDAFNKLCKDICF